MDSERKALNPSSPNIFHGVEYPLTFLFYQDCFGRIPDEGEEVGYNNVGALLRLPSGGPIPRAYLYWMVDADGISSVHCLGKRQGTDDPEQETVIFSQNELDNEEEYEYDVTSAKRSKRKRKKTRNKSRR